MHPLRLLVALAVFFSALGGQPEAHADVRGGALLPPRAAPLPPPRPACASSRVHLELLAGYPSITVGAAPATIGLGFHAHVELLVNRWVFATGGRVNYVNLVPSRSQGGGLRFSQSLAAPVGFRFPVGRRPEPRAYLQLLAGPAMLISERSIHEPGQHGSNLDLGGSLWLRAGLPSAIRRKTGYSMPILQLTADAFPLHSDVHPRRPIVHFSLSLGSSWHIF